MDNKIFDKILTEIGCGNFQAAIQYCDEILIEYPNNRSVFEIRSGCHYALGDFDSAISDLTYSIVKLKSGEDSRGAIINLYSKRGKIHLEKNDWLKASEDFKKILILNPSLSEIQNSLAVCYRKMDNYNDAFFHSSQAIKLNHEYAEAYNNRANINISLGNYHEAIADYTRSIELNPLNANAYFNRGSIYYDILKNKGSAIQDFLKSININPNFKEELKKDYPELINTLDKKQESEEKVDSKENIVVTDVIPVEVTDKPQEEITTEEIIVENTVIPVEITANQDTELINNSDDKQEIKEEDITPTENINENAVIPEEILKEEDASIEFSLDDFESLFKEGIETKENDVLPLVEEPVLPLVEEPVLPLIEEPVPPSVQGVNKSDDIVIPELDLKSIFSNADISDADPNIEEEPTTLNKPVISDDIKSLHDEIQTSNQKEEESSRLMGGIRFGEMSNFENKEPVFDSDPNSKHMSKIVEQKKSFLRSPLFFIILIILMAIIIILSVLKFFKSQENQIFNIPGDVKIDSSVEKSTDTLKEEIKDTISKNDSEQKKEPEIKSEEVGKNEDVTAKETKKDAELMTKNLGFISDKKQFVLFSEPDGYYVQIGSYKEKQKADEKITFLGKNNIKGKVIEVDLKEKGIFYRVRAGVFSTPEEAKEKTIKIE